jgi:hypothetical protein
MGQIGSNGYSVPETAKSMLFHDTDSGTDYLKMRKFSSRVSRISSINCNKIGVICLSVQLYLWMFNIYAEIRMFHLPFGIKSLPT